MGLQGHKINVAHHVGAFLFIFFIFTPTKAGPVPV